MTDTTPLSLKKQKITYGYLILLRWLLLLLVKMRVGERFIMPVRLLRGRVAALALMREASKRSGST
jgi:hypothetical protein